MGVPVEIVARQSALRRSAAVICRGATCSEWIASKGQLFWRWQPAQKHGAGRASTEIHQNSPDRLNSAAESRRPQKRFEQTNPPRALTPLRGQALWPTRISTDRNF